MPESGSQVQLEIVIGPQTLDQLHAAFETFWSLNDAVPTSIRMQVGIAVAEVAANIVEHSDAQWLWVRVHTGRTQVHVDFTDNGTAVQINIDDVAMPDELAERGRGLALAKSALGLLSYHRDKSGNHWRLISQAFGIHGGQAIA